MRIIAGKYRRRRLQGPPEGAKTRPIPDNVKEAIFNLLRGHFEGEAVIDLFAGTGALGIEALSHGASRVVFVERDRRVAKVLEENLAEIGSPREGEIAMGDALGAAPLSRCPRPVHIIFMDPPYPLVREPEGWDRVRTQASRLIANLDETGYAVIRTPWPHIHRPGEPGHDGETDDDAPMTGGPRPKPVDLPLEIEGAIGPETHVYRHTAVHLYMRKPADDPAGDGTAGDGAAGAEEGDA